jgi:hypothetical protein
VIKDLVDDRLILDTGDYLGIPSTLLADRYINIEHTYQALRPSHRAVTLCGCFSSDGDGFPFEHRRDWIVEKLKQLDGIFSISIVTYSVMHYHTHILLKIDRESALKLRDDEVIDRWTNLYKPSPMVSRYLNGIKLSKAEQDVVDEDIEKWRHRLYDISWFMRNLNESIARQANEEDSCTGRFLGRQIHKPSPA